MEIEKDDVSSEENGKVVSFRFSDSEEAEDTSVNEFADDDFVDVPDIVLDDSFDFVEVGVEPKKAEKPVNKREPIKKNEKNSAKAEQRSVQDVKAAKKPEAEIKTETIVKKPEAEIKTETIVKKPEAEIKTETIDKQPEAMIKTETMDKKSEAKEDAAPVKAEAEAPAKDEEEEVVFGAVPKKEQKKDKKTDRTAVKKTESKQEPVKEAKKEEAGKDDEIVFAATTKAAPKKRIAQQKMAKRKSNIPVIPILASAAVICLAVVGAIFVINGSGEPEVAEKNESVVSEEVKDAVASDQEDSLNANPMINAESADIKTINTSSIVFGNNVTVSGVKVAGLTLNQAYDALQSKLKSIRDTIKIKINCGAKNIVLTEDDFTFDTDVSNVLIQAYHFSRGELEKPTVTFADNAGTYDFKVTSVLNKNSIGDAVKKVADKFDVQPQDAHVKSFNPEAKEKFTYADGSDGYLISQKKVTDEITKILEQPEKVGTFTVTAVRTSYKKSLNMVKANTKLIGSHCTSCTNVWASVYNMQLAIKTCNGYVVNPGETFSFNEMTGDTTTGALGYVPSTAIVSGGYEQQYGGGICQASTTIYIAALKAGMSVVERHAHQYPSSYAAVGTDATVDYGNLDMKFKNPYDYPVYIATYVYDCNGDGIDEICVEFYGPLSAEWDEIVPIGWVTELGGSVYSVKGAQVYFKDGKEVRREYTPEGNYDYTGESWGALQAMMPKDVEHGPTNVQPTGQPPTIYSPNGCGSSAPVPYGTASQYLSGTISD